VPIRVADSMVMTRRTHKPQLITDAPRNPEEELRSREIRYVIMMGLRASCVIAGGILVMTRPPLVGLWLILCVVAAVILPWAAVLLANDKAPRDDARLRNKFQRQAPATPAEPQQPMITEHETAKPKVIDADD
jgi:hypothetical protein